MNKREAREELLEKTAYTFLETLPAVMGHITCELRRKTEVDNPAHFWLLRTLRQGKKSLHELADLQSVRLPTMSRTVSVLENRQWVERRRSEEDRRTVYTHITEKGLQVLEEVEQMANTRVREMLSSIEDAKLEAFEEGMKELYEKMEERFGPPEEGAC
jgi:DNA-binding MarR family transcriptional regulator